jgi:hypothetical protein
VLGAFALYWGFVACDLALKIPPVFVVKIERLML